MPRFPTPFAITLAAVAALLAVEAPAQECLNWGDLDKQLYCDESRDLVADTPTRGFQLKDPDTLVFAYAPEGDPSAYREAFAEFTRHLSERTGKEVRWQEAKSNAGQIKSMRAGDVHVAGIAPGPTVYAVNLAGYVPIAVMCNDDGTFGYRLDIVTKKDSGITTLGDLSGGKVARADPLSFFGDAAAHAMFRQFHVVPGKGVEVIYSGSEEASVKGVLSGEYPAAAVNSNVLSQLEKRGAIDRKELRTVWSSRTLPPTSFGFAYNLAPDLQRRIHDAFLTFDWKGTGLASTFGPAATRFCTVSYADTWAPVRLMQKESGVVYDEKSL